MSSAEGGEGVHTIHYTCCVPWAAICSTIQRVRTSSIEIRSNCAAIRISHFAANCELRDRRDSCRVFDFYNWCTPRGGYAHTLVHIGAGFSDLGELRRPHDRCLDTGRRRKRRETWTNCKSRSNEIKRDISEILDGQKCFQTCQLTHRSHEKQAQPCTGSQTAHRDLNRAR